MQTLFKPLFQGSGIANTNMEPMKYIVGGFA